MRFLSQGGMVATLFVMATILPQHSYADVKAGETLAKKGAAGTAPCMQCHGPNGEGQAANVYPRLAGQKQGYLEKQLLDFKNGRRIVPVMQAMVKPLTPNQLADVAAYYASLDPWQVTKASANPNVTPGFQLAQKGKWDKGMPACFACHGEKGVGVAPSFPALAGQNAAYTAKQLNAWKAGTRTNDPQGLMKAVADKMTPEEITTVSAYFENLQ